MGVGEVGKERRNDCADVECCCLEGLGGRSGAAGDNKVALSCPSDGSQLDLQRGYPAQPLIKEMA